MVDFMPYVYICLMLYSFFCQAVICEEFFVPALNVIIDRFKIPDDVAGATLMAMGTSAPELFCAIIALFVTRTIDSGVGTIVGSDLFNMLMICGGSAIVGGTLYLDWTALAREIFFYALSIVLLYWAMADSYVTQLEAWTLTGSYVVYTIVCCTQAPLMRKFAPMLADRRDAAIAPVVQVVSGAPVRVPTFHSAAPLVEPEPDEADEENAEGLPRHGKTEPLLLKRAGTSPTFDSPDETSAMKEAVKEKMGLYSGLLQERAKIHLAGGHVWHQYYAVISARNKQLCCYDSFSAAKKGAGNKRKYQSWAPGLTADAGSDLRTLDLASMKECTPVKDEECCFKLLPLDALNPIVFRCGTKQERDAWVAQIGPECNKLTGEEKEEVLQHGSLCDHLRHVGHEVSHIPSGFRGKICWLLSLPHTIAFGVTIPDVKQPQFEKYYALSALMFLVWLPILSFLMVKSVNGIAEAWGIDKAIMALTISAAGTSFPDFFASMVVARDGQGDMACANAFGSNIFNIFLASGAPWAVFATFWLTDADAVEGGVGGYTPDGELALHIPSPDIVSGIITLAISLVLFVLVMICTKFKLTAATGWMFAAVYFVYIGVMVYNQLQKDSS